MTLRWNSRHHQVMLWHREPGGKMTEMTSDVYKNRSRSSSSFRGGRPKTASDWHQPQCRLGNQVQANICFSVLNCENRWRTVFWWWRFMNESVAVNVSVWTALSLQSRSPSQSTAHSVCIILRLSFASLSSTFQVCVLTFSSFWLFVWSLAFTDWCTFCW